LFFHCSNRIVSPAALWNRVLHILTTSTTSTASPEAPPVVQFQSSRNIICKPDYLGFVTRIIILTAPLEKKIN
jgi:hypothetical protein